jgi:hypothetical protein
LLLQQKFSNGLTCSEVLDAVSIAIPPTLNVVVSLPFLVALVADSTSKQNVDFTLSFDGFAWIFIVELTVRVLTKIALLALFVDHVDVAVYNVCPCTWLSRISGNVD